MIRLDRRQAFSALGYALGSLSLAPWSAAQTQLSPPSSSVMARTEQPAKLLVRLSLNENPYGPAPGVTDAIVHELSNVCRYTGAELDGLIDLIAERESVPRDQVILGEILEPLGTHLSLQGGSGGQFIYSDPGYTALIDAATAVGGHAVPVPLNAQLENDLPGIEAQVNQHTRAVSLVNPHNPTGIVSGAHELKDFAHRLSGRTLVIVDEAYLEYTDEFAQRTLADLVRAGENVIVFRTLSKIYGLAGLEIGYGLVPRGIAATLIAQGANNPHQFNRLAVAAASASLRAAGYIPRVRSLVAAQREQWLRMLRELQLRFTPSAANFIFVETGMPHASFAAAMLAEGIDIGRGFPPYDTWARISIGLPHENAVARSAMRRILRQRKS
jgi:histidinol-phosphate aminotransferase